MVCRNAGVMFMCGRYQFSLQQYDDLAQILADAQRRSRQLSELNFAMADPITTPAHGAAADIAPTNIAPVMIASGNRVVGEFQKWGIPNFQGKLVINARAETVTEKPMFRRSIAAQRCVVPASAYYEWDAGKRKYCFTLPDQPLFFAGIYDVVNGMNCFVILTTAPKQYNPNQFFPIGDGFGLFVYFERYEQVYFPNGYRILPTSKPRGPRKKKPKE